MIRSTLALSLPTAVRAVLVGAAVLFVSTSSVAARQVESPVRAGVSAYVVVLAGRLNIRERPALDGRVVGSAARADTLCVVRYEGDWAAVRSRSTGGPVSDLSEGFVSRGFVSEVRATAAELDAMGCGVPPSRDPEHGDSAGAINSR